MKTMVGLVVSILIIFSVVLFWPSSSIKDINTPVMKEISISNETAIISDDEDTGHTVIKLNTPADDLKSEQMAAEYKVLEKARSKLKQQLARLKHELWGLKFPSDQAKEMNEIMLNAHKLLKNPNLLGAFSDVQGIKDELDKINFANKALEDVKTMIEINKQNMGTSE